jgi:hypothetical protein
MTSGAKNGPHRDNRRQRLAAELRANLAKRKGQARARAASQGEAPRHRGPDKSEESNA